MYDGSVLQDVFHDIVDTKVEVEQTKHQEIRKYLWIVVVAIVVVVMFRKKSRG